jgi:hypothetical protein
LSTLGTEASGKGLCAQRLLPATVPPGLGGCGVNRIAGELPIGTPPDLEVVVLAYRRSVAQSLRLTEFGLVPCTLFAHFSNA